MVYHRFGLLGQNKEFVKLLGCLKHIAEFKVSRYEVERFFAHFLCRCYALPIMSFGLAESVLMHAGFSHQILHIELGLPIVLLSGLQINKLQFLQGFLEKSLLTVGQDELLIGHIISVGHTNLFQEGKRLRSELFHLAETIRSHRGYQVIYPNVSLQLDVLLSFRVGRIFFYEVFERFPSGVVVHIIHVHKMQLPIGVNLSLTA